MCQSLRLQRLVSHPTLSARAYLKLGVAVVDEDVGGLQLGDVAVTLELLPHLGANGGDGNVESVHGLDLGGLSFAPGVSLETLVLRSSLQFQCFLASSSRSSRV